MGIARQHGDKRTSNRGHSAHQDLAHRYLTSQGFEFYRMSGKASNIYKDKRGQIIRVDATPRNSSNAMTYLHQAVENNREEKHVTTTTEVKPTLPLVAMADPFLLKQPQNRLQTQARNQALAGWVRRVLERHGPLDPAVLNEAALELGFGTSQIKLARTAASVVAYTIPGAGAGKGKGGNPTWIALDHQVPENASRLGRAQPAPGGVVSEALELPEHPIGENNGQGPEPREEPSEALQDAELAKNLAEAAMVDAAFGEQPVKQWTPNALLTGPEGDVSAAAQLLLQTLGLKTADPRMDEGLVDLDEFLSDLAWRVDKAREKVATLRSLLS